MYKLDLPLDNKEVAAIARRRALEEERKTRVFNAKYRTIGVDLQALQQQVSDRKEQESRERLRDEAFGADAVKHDKIGVLLERREEEERRRINHATNDFRALHQQPDSRREWDLYDPDYLKKDKPARVSDDDPRCGVSSIQKFEGEDLNEKARRKFQQEQAREWYKQQERLKEEAKQNQMTADRLYELKMKELDQRACELQNAEEECRRAINIATKDFNDALNREQEERRRLKAKQEQDDNDTEVANHIFSDILTENPAQAKSLFGAHRVVTDRWKGMSPEQLDEILRAQEAQRREKERLRQEQLLLDHEWDKQRVAQDRVSVLKEREAERRRKNAEAEQATENLRMKEEQNAYKQYLDREVYTNKPTASYFMQFNTSSR